MHLSGAKRSILSAFLLSFFTVNSLAVANPCELPFRNSSDVIPGAPFPLSSLQVSAAAPSRHVPTRFIVVDLDTVGADGRCRGIAERYPNIDDVTDFILLRQIARARGVALFDLLTWSDSDLIAIARGLVGAHANIPIDGERIGFEKRALHSYQQRVVPFTYRQPGRAESGFVVPVVKAPNHEGYCIGQRVHICELRENGLIAEIGRFATSAAHTKFNAGGGPPRTYYAPINHVNSRRWATEWARYQDFDRWRDYDMGGAYVGRPQDSQEGGRVLYYTNNGTAEMPAFVNFVPDPGYPGERGNGFHERSRAEVTASQLGAPVSHGCIRLTDFASKFLRWWIPLGAKTFFAYRTDRYRLYANGDGTPRRP